MRIVHITQFFDPGRGYQEVHLANAQIRQGHEVYVISARLAQSWELVKPREQQRLLPGGSFVTAEGVRYQRLEAKQVSSRLMLQGLNAALDAISPDWIVAHGASTLLPFQTTVWALLRRFRGRITIDDHTTRLMRRRSFAGNAFYHLYRIFGTRFLRLVCRDYVAVTPETVAVMTGDLGFPREEIKQISLGADADLFRPASDAERSVMRAKLGFRSDALLIVSAGRVAAPKRVVELIRAVADTASRHPEVALLLIGEAEASYADAFRTALRESGLGPDRLVWLEWIPNRELAPYLSCADIGLWPGNESAVHLEAMACGLPIVIRELGSLADRIEDGNGVFTDGTVADIVAKLEPLITSPSLRRKMGDLARLKIERDLSWTRIAERFEEPPNYTKGTNTPS